MGDIQLKVENNTKKSNTCQILEHLVGCQNLLFRPPIGVAGMPTPIRFFSGVNGDFVVLQPHNCTDAQAVVTSSNSLARSVVTDYRVLTEASMTASGDLRVCYATFESDGDSSDDYVALQANF